MQVKGAKCFVCGDVSPASEMVARIMFISADESTDDEIFPYPAHPDCDENATPEQLNAIRDAILGE